ncbi:hypothetical protein [Nibrella viscosa]
MKTTEKKNNVKVASKKPKQFKTAEEAFHAKHRTVRELLKNVDLSKLKK